MANQIAQDKQRINLVISKSLVSQLDGIAARDGKTRSAVIVEALVAYVSGKPGTDSASGAKLDAVMLKLDAIASAQGELKAQQLAQSTVIADAIKNQPIAVQQALPAPEVTDEDVIAYLREKRPDIPLNAWGEPTPPQARKKGLFGRIFG
mgnify:CR=1 FL=1